MSDLAAAYFTDKKFAPVRPLIVDLLPGISRADIAAAFVGELMRHVARLRPNHRCPHSYYEVFMIVLGHAGHHSNRVWASQYHIAELGIKLFNWDGTPESNIKTVQRAMHFWSVIFPIFRKITDQEELLSGPGEWMHIDRGRKKRGRTQTNHYDIEGLKPYCPQAFAGALEALIMGGQYTPPVVPNPMQPVDLDKRYPDPYSEQEVEAKPTRRAKNIPVLGVRPAQVISEADISRGNDELTEAGFYDPFDAHPPQVGNGVESFDEPKNVDNFVVDAEISDSTVQALGSAGQPLLENDISKRPENVEMSDKYREAGGQKKSTPNRAATPGFNRTILTDRKIRYGAPAPAAPGAAQIPLQTDPRNITAEVHELVRRNVDVGMAITMRKRSREKWDDEKSRKWLRELLAFGQWKSAEDGTVYDGAWYNAVFQNWMDDKAVSWPDPAMDAIGRAEAAYNKSAEGRGFVVPQTSPEVIIAAPPPKSESKPAADPLPSSVFAELDKYLTRPPSPDPVVSVTPIMLTAAPPEALSSVWQDVLKEAQTVFPIPFFQTIIRTLSPAALGLGERSGGENVVTLKTHRSWTKDTLDGKPDKLQMLSRLIADALSIDAKTLTVQIAVIKDG